MSQYAWVCTAPARLESVRPVRNDISEQFEDEFEFEKISDKVRDGFPLEPSERPNEIFGQPYAKAKDYDFPDLFYGFGFWIVSQAIKDVLNGFDIGTGSIEPVKVLKSDRKTEVGSGWHCLVIGNRKDALVVDETKGLRDFPGGRFTVGIGPNADDVALQKSCLTGSDIWVDVKLFNSFFLSGGLGEALENAGLHKRFHMSKCKVI